MAKNAISVVLDKVNKADYATFDSMAEMREAVNAHVKTIEESDLRPNMKTKLVRLLDFLRDNSRVQEAACDCRLLWRQKSGYDRYLVEEACGVWLR
jgi:DNA-binding transcriptional regulator YbjK